MTQPFQAECPICEALTVFEASQKKVKCRQCHQWFAPENIVPSVASEGDRARTSRVPDPTPQVPLPPAQPPSTRRSPTVSPKSESGPKNGGTAGEPIAPHAKEEPWTGFNLEKSTTSLIMLKYEERQRRQRIMRLLFTLGVLLAATGVGAVVYLKVAQESRLRSDGKAQNSDQEPAVDTPPVADSAERPKNQDPAKPVKPETETEAEVVKSWEPARFAYNTVRDAEELWSRIYPSIFEIKVSRQGLESTTCGVLLDSRGWVVTSYSAVKDATSLTCRMAPSQMRFNFDATAVTDAVQGILAVDESLDLAVLQVNRKLVEVLSPLTTATRPPVIGVHTLMVVPPAISKAAWVSESRIAFEGHSNPLPSNLKLQLEGVGLDPTKSWQTHETVVSVVPGSVFFTAKQELLGIAVKTSESQKGVVVSASELAGLLKKASQPPSPGTEPQPPVDSPVVLDVPELEPKSNQFELSRDLNAAGRECLKTGWVPETPETMDALALFLRRLQAVKDGLRLREQRIRLEDELILNKQIKFWTSESRLLVDNPGLTQIRTLLAASGLDRKGALPARPVLAYIEIVHAATLGEKVHYAKVLETDIHLSLPVDPEKFVMDPRSRWLIVLEEVATNSVTTDLGAKKINAHAAVISAAVELIER